PGWVGRRLGRGGLAAMQRAADAIEHQVAGADYVGASQHHRALDGVFELAHVARPRVLKQHRLRVGPKRHMAAGARGEALKKMARQWQDILAPLAQSSEHDRDYVEPEVEILAEAARGDLVLERGVGRR